MTERDVEIAELRTLLLREGFAFHRCWNSLSDVQKSDLAEQLIGEAERFAMSNAEGPISRAEYEDWMAGLKALDGDEGQADG